MTKKELIKNAYEEFYEYVENSADENGWVKREEHSGFMRSHFYLGKNIETKFIDKVEYWRPKTLEGIENNNGWIVIRSEEDLPRESDAYFVAYFFKGKLLFQYLRAFRINSDDTEYWLDNFTHYQPITKPNPPLWTEEK